MIFTGIDLVEVARCALWINYSNHRLSRIFSAQEIIYCKAVPLYAAQRFAARFAAKEALFKALSASKQNITLLTLMRHAQVIKSEHGPQFQIDWQALQVTPLRIQLSISHTPTTAVALVIIS